MVDDGLRWVMLRLPVLEPTRSSVTGHTKQRKMGWKDRSIELCPVPAVWSAEVQGGIAPAHRTVAWEQSDISYSHIRFYSSVTQHSNACKARTIAKPQSRPSSREGWVPSGEGGCVVSPPMQAPCCTNYGWWNGEMMRIWLGKPTNLFHTYVLYLWNRVFKWTGFFFSSFQASTATSRSTGEAKAEEANNGRWDPLEKKIGFKRMTNEHCVWDVENLGLHHPAYQTSVGSGDHGMGWHWHARG